MKTSVSYILYNLSETHDNSEYDVHNEYVTWSCCYTILYTATGVLDYGNKILRYSDLWTGVTAASQPPARLSLLALGRMLITQSTNLTKNILSGHQFPTPLCHVILNCCRLMNLQETGLRPTLCEEAIDEAVHELKH